MSSGDLLICRILTFEVRIFVIVYFQLIKNSLKLRKRVLLVNVFLFDQLIEKENKYYVIFVLQNSKLGKFSKSRDDLHTTKESTIVFNENECCYLY